MASIHHRRMSDWTNRSAPGFEVFETLASETLASLPHEILQECGNLQISLADYPEDAMLNELQIEDPYELLGLFQGQGLREDVAEVLTGQFPNQIWLFRRPILDYWAASNETLGEVVSHVLIHEIGHHFGLSDDDMERIEAAAS